MKYVVNIFTLLVIVAILVYGELYLKMERNRTIAKQCLKNLTEPFADWIACSERILTAESKDVELSSDLTTAITYYNNLNKTQLFERPEAINEIHRLVKLIVANEGDNPAVVAIGKELTQLFVLFVDTIDKYNLSVYKLDLQLNKAFFGITGKISRFKKLDSIVNLTVL